MAESSSPEPLNYAALKAKHRALRDGFPNNLSLRIHRALSWLDRAEAESNDQDAAFIFLWIAFNAAYANELNDSAFDNERSIFEEYFGKLTHLDTEQRIYKAIWLRFAQEIRLLLRNKFVYQPFWKFHNGIHDYADWEDRFERSKRRTATALSNQDTKVILSTLFDRLYVLRNQLIHGGSTWNSSVNRDQVKDGAAILGFLVPLFFDVMMNNPDIEWGEPYYPVVE